MAIERIAGAVNPASLLSTKAPGAAGLAGKSFGEIIGEAVSQVDDMQKKSDQAIEDLTVGRRRTLHETMIEVEKASLSFQMLLSLRNKAISAYKEVMAMHF